MFLLKCPNCGNQMKYQENLNSPQKKPDISKKSKRCVYCGRSFKVLGHILRHSKPQEISINTFSENPFN